MVCNSSKVKNKRVRSKKEKSIFCNILTKECYIGVPVYPQGKSGIY